MKCKDCCYYVFIEKDMLFGSCIYPTDKLPYWLQEHDNTINGNLDSKYCESFTIPETTVLKPPAKSRAANIRIGK
jgi:hypothetical protein